MLLWPLLLEIKPKQFQGEKESHWNFKLIIIIKKKAFKKKRNFSIEVYPRRPVKNHFSNQPESLNFQDQTFCVSWLWYCMKKTAFLLQMFPLNLIKSLDLTSNFQEYEGQRNKLNGNKKKIRQLPKVNYLKGQPTISAKSVSYRVQGMVGAKGSRNSSRLKPSNQMQMHGSWVGPGLNKSWVKDIWDNWGCLNID